MSIYRPARSRWPLAIAAGVAGVAVGLAAGGILFGDEPATPAEALAPARESLRRASGALEIVAVEYEESVTGGGVVRAPEYEAARSALRRSRAHFDEARPALEILDEGRVEEVARSYVRIGELMSERAPADEVEARLDTLGILLDG